MFDEIFNFMLCELVGILNFSILVIKCCFDDGKDSYIIWFVDWMVCIDVNDGMMKLMSCIWDNVWIVLVCVQQV